MKDPKRSKKEIERRLREIAYELVSLNEHPKFKNKMSLEEKISKYSTRWRNLYIEGSAEICLYAEKMYPSHSGESSRTAKHGILLMKIAHDCFKNFKPEDGDFINYISHVICIEFAKSEKKEIADELKGGIIYSSSTAKIAKNFIKWTEEYGKDSQSIKVQEWYCKYVCSDLSVDNLNKALRLEFETNVMEETVSTDEQKDVSIFESFAINNDYLENEEFDEEKYTTIFNKIEKTFQKQQLRTKPYISALITFNILKEIEKKEKTSFHIKISDLLAKYAFSDQEILSNWKAGYDIGRQKDICRRFKPDLSIENAESDASRTFKKFLEKMN